MTAQWCYQSLATAGDTQCTRCVTAALGDVVGERKEVALVDYGDTVSYACRTLPYYDLAEINVSLQ